MNLILGADPGVGVNPGGAGIGGGAHGGANPPGSIRVTKEEMDSIDRLTQLGFPKHKAAEAYFACDKNEELAANFLFETGGQGSALIQLIERSGGEVVGISVMLDQMTPEIRGKFASYNIHTLVRQEPDAS